MGVDVSLSTDYGSSHFCSPNQNPRAKFLCNWRSNLIACPRQTHKSIFNRKGYGGAIYSESYHPAVAERIERLLTDSSSSEDKSLDSSFADDGRNGTLVIGNDNFSAYLVGLPTAVESYKTYDDNVLIKTADIGQMIMVREEGESVAEAMEYRHGLTPPMRDTRRRRFRREPDLHPDVVHRVEKDLQNIMAGGTAENIAVEMAEPEELGDNAGKKVVSTPSAKPDVRETGVVGGEPDHPDRSD